MSERKIPLTGRPPVSIETDNWPLIASAIDYAYDGEFDFQANKEEHAKIRVRQHQDGRAIIYGSYQYDTRWAHERNRNYHGGILLDSHTSPQDICDAINKVCGEMPMAEMLPESIWDELSAECIADMPVEKI